MAYTVTCTVEFVSEVLTVIVSITSLTFWDALTIATTKLVRTTRCIHCCRCHSHQIKYTNYRIMKSVQLQRLVGLRADLSTIHALLCAATLECMRCTVSVVIRHNVTSRLYHVSNAQQFLIDNSNSHPLWRLWTKFQKRHYETERNEKKFCSTKMADSANVYAYFVGCKTYCNFVHPTDRSSLECHRNACTTECTGHCHIEILQPYSLHIHTHWRTTSSSGTVFNKNIHVLSWNADMYFVDHFMLLWHFNILYFCDFILVRGRL